MNSKNNQRRDLRTARVAVRLRLAFLAISAASLIAMLLHGSLAAIGLCAALPFPHQLVIYELGGSLLPLAIVGCLGFIDTLLRDRADTRLSTQPNCMETAGRG